MGKNRAKCFKKNPFTLHEKDFQQTDPGLTHSHVADAYASGNWSRINYKAQYTRSLGGSDPCITFGRQFRTKPGVATAQTGVFRPRPIL